MNELKPEDIMRALECCIETQCKNCCNLGSWHEQWNCMTDLMKKALALLREKDEEIERQKALKKIAYDNNHQCHRLGYEDAITEFAERLKAQAIPVTGGRGFEGVNRMATNLLIDKIAKEMKEQNDEKKS